VIETAVIFNREDAHSSIMTVADNLQRHGRTFHKSGCAHRSNLLCCWAPFRK